MASIDKEAYGAEEACDGVPEHGCCECRHKDTERSEAFQADIQKRLNRAIGQLNGVKAMIEDNRYCGDVLVQVSAVESAVRAFGYLVLEDHMNTCVAEKIRAGDENIVSETVELIKKLN